MDHVTPLITSALHRPTSKGQQTSTPLCSRRLQICMICSGMRLLLSRNISDPKSDFPVREVGLMELLAFTDPAWQNTSLPPH